MKNTGSIHSCVDLSIQLFKNLHLIKSSDFLECLFLSSRNSTLSNILEMYQYIIYSKQQKQFTRNGFE